MPVVPPVMRMVLFFMDGMKCSNGINVPKCVKKSAQNFQGQAGAVPKRIAVTEGAGGHTKAEQGVVEESGKGDRILAPVDLAPALGRAKPGGEQALNLARV